MDLMDLMELFTQAPGIVGILIIVRWTLKAMRSRDALLKDLGKDYEDSRDQCHKVQRDAIDSMRENSRVLGENSAVMREITTLLHRMNGSKPS